MPDLGIFGWIIVGLLAGAMAGFFVPGRERYGCLGTTLIGILGAALGGVFSILFAVVPGLSLGARQVLSQVASSLVTAAISPIPALTIALLYFDMRVRKEGYDLEELARQAAQGPAPA